MLAVVLALGASVAYGVSNFLAPLQSRRHSVAAVLVAGQVAALVGAAVLLAVAGGAVPDGEAVAIGVLAGVGNLLGLACFYRAAQLGPLSVAAPIGATGAVVPVAYGISTGEAITTLQAAGIVLAIGGAALAARGRGPAAERTPVTGVAVAYAAASALAFGVFLVALPVAAEDGTWWALFDARASLVVLLLVGLLALGQPLRVPLRHVPALSVPGLLLLLGTLLYALAAQEGLLSLVSVIGALFPVVTVGLALLFFKERLAPSQFAGIAAAMMGVCLIAV